MTLPPPAGLPEVGPRAPRGGLDGRRRSGGVPAGRGCGERRRDAARAELGVPVVLFSTDYVFDGRKREPYVESDAPNPLSVYGRTKLQAEAVAGEDAWVVRTSWLFGWTSTNFVRTMLRLGAERDEVAGGRRPARLAHVRRAPRRRGARAARSAAAGSGTSPRTATARGPSSPRRSSRTRGSTAASGGSRPRSSTDLRRGPRTRCCGASGPTRRRCRTGATGYAPAWSGLSLTAGRQVVEVEIDVLAGSDANAFPVELELDLDACRRADGVEPVSLLDCAPGFLERPLIVVDDAAPGLRVADRANMPVGTTDDADDSVLGDAPPPRRFQLAASLLLSGRAGQ